MIAYHITKSGATFFLKGRPLSISRESSHWDQVWEVYQTQDEDQLENILDPRVALSTFSHERLTYREGQLVYGGQKLPLALTEKILALYEGNLPFEPFVRFYERLQLNPSNRAVEQLYRFLETGIWPLLEDGKILAYKYVSLNPYKDKEDTPELRAQAAKLLEKQTSPMLVEDFEDYYSRLRTKTYIDSYSNSFPQDIGDTVAVPRNAVDEDPNSHCSKGLHVCSHAYLGGRSDNVLYVSVDPADWVSVPTDANSTKARVHRYTILGVYEGLIEAPISTIPLPDRQDYEDPEDYEDEDEDEDEGTYEDYEEYSDDEEEY